MNFTHIRVTNHNTDTIDDRYDGILYLFEPEKAKLVPIVAAALMFGFPVDDDGNVQVGNPPTPDWEHVKRRWGWNTVQRRKDEEMHDAVMRTNALAATRCKAIELEAVTMALREVRADAEQLPAPRESAVAEEADEVAPPPRGRIRG